MSEQEIRDRYIDAEIEALGDYPFGRLKITTPTGETKWISVSRTAIEKIQATLKELSE